MKSSIALQAGLAFGIAALAGGAVSVAFNSRTSERATTATVERLNVLDITANLIPDPQSVGLVDSISDYLDGATVHRAASAFGVNAYIAEMKDGSLCVAAVTKSDGVSMTCGTPEMAAAGKIAFRSQARSDSPSLFVGIAPNEIESATVGTSVGTVEFNAFIVIGKPDDGTYALAGDGRTPIVIDMKIGEVPLDAMSGDVG